MRITNPNDATNPFYAGICKNEEAPKHVLNKDTAGQTRKIKVDGKPALIVEAPKSKDYTYFKMNDKWYYIKDKSIFAENALTTTKITRSPKGEASTEIEPIIPTEG